MKKNELRIKITDILYKLGISANIKGFEYLREAICMFYKNKALAYESTSALHEKIAKKYNTTIDIVESSMRYAIEKSALIGNIELIRYLFGYSISPNKYKPSVSLFVCTIAEKLKLGYELKLKGEQ